VTTPILLAGLVLLVFHEHGKAGEVGGYLTSVIVLDVLMIVTGLILSLAAQPMAKWIWYGWSCVEFLGVLYLLWSPLQSQALSRGAALGTVYGKNLIFLVGPEGLKLITDPASVWAFHRRGAS
jgi:bacteriorhodopsin